MKTIWQWDSVGRGDLVRIMKFICNWFFDHQDTKKIDIKIIITPKGEGK